MKTILCYGDSNTHGTMPMASPGVSERHPKGARWTDVMATELGAGFDVIAEGLPGRTTVHDDPVEGGVRNGASVLPAILHSHKPIDLLVIMLGTNDLKSRFSVTSYEIARSVERLVTMARAEAVHTRELIVAPVPVRRCGSLVDVFDGFEVRQEKLSEYLEDVARRSGCGFFDAGTVAKTSDIDGVHMDADAHRALGKALAKALLDQGLA